MTVDDIHLDLYVPYLSRLGQALQLRVEDLAANAETIDTWTVLDLPGHIASRLAALTDRPHTAPGTKDRYELAALVLGGDDATTTMATLRRASAQPTTALAEAVTSGLGHLDDGTRPPGCVANCTVLCGTGRKPPPSWPRDANPTNTTTTVRDDGDAPRPSHRFTTPPADTAALDAVHQRSPPTAGPSWSGQASCNS